MAQPKSYLQLQHQLQQLPGIGEQAARRLSRYLLVNDQAQALASAINDARSAVQLCQDCRRYCQGSVCQACQQDEQGKTLLIVAQDDDAERCLERGFKGRFFVLHGWLNPIAGVGPHSLGLTQLLPNISRFQPGAVYLFSDGSVEAQVTAQFIEGLLLNVDALPSGCAELTLECLLEQESDRHDLGSL